MGNQNTWDCNLFLYIIYNRLVAGVIVPGVYTTFKGNSIQQCCSGSDDMQTRIMVLNNVFAAYFTACNGTMLVAVVAL